jgi:hypothetical protein
MCRGTCLESTLNLWVTSNSVTTSVLISSTSVQ